MIGRGRSTVVGSCNFCTAWSSPEGVTPHDVVVIDSRSASLRACLRCAHALRDALARDLRGVRAPRPAVSVGRPRPVGNYGGALHSVAVDVTGADARQLAAAARLAADAGAEELGPGSYEVRPAPRPDGSRPLAGAADRAAVVERAKMLADMIRRAVALPERRGAEGGDDDRG